MSKREIGYFANLTDYEHRALYKAFNERRKGSLEIKVNAQALFNLLRDHDKLYEHNKSTFDHASE